jgi:hypothetical protein
MDSGSLSISEMYKLQGQAFEDRFHVLAANVRRVLLEGYVRTPLTDDDEDVLVTLARAVFAGYKALAAGASLTAEQADDFAGRVDDVVAGAIVDISRCEGEFPDRTTADFHREAAKRLGIPVASTEPTH